MAVHELTMTHDLTLLDGRNRRNRAKGVLVPIVKRWKAHEFFLRVMRSLHHLMGTTLQKSQRRQAQIGKTKHLLYCALSPSEFNRISSYVIAKEIWDGLLITVEGTVQVWETKMNIIFGNYKMFKMKSNETKIQMFTKVVNGLAN